jgi:hypothetical protein
VVYPGTQRTTKQQQHQPSALLNCNTNIIQHKKHNQTATPYPQEYQTARTSNSNTSPNVNTKWQQQTAQPNSMHKVTK